ncbi:ras-like GTP-binding protein RhoL [Vanessa tameamea]|uniref:Ras-like GTP-binding protein RhoL n=1 Tax=Vanessa tameamea TaxID=334116 RepID=A0A8B8HJN3_VANTA|nr:ras-like GTP-binding protein RhoL [Vanessa tameamea]XP_046971522.1 ras-like GTP-binding protein RhoL [Vanessa cardui]XP_047539928.1 ras-like GTP-binding protein RhoL [Vanessa atalanta]
MGTVPRLKITVVGDGMVGKTCLLYVYTRNEFPKEYVPTVFDNYVGHITVDGQEVEMALWDTAGQEDYERLRPLSYNNTHCFLVCYSVGTRSSYENVIHKWYPELKHFSSLVPIVLVATKTDLRASGKAVITTQEGKTLKKKIRAVQLVECSALERENMHEVFEEAVRAALRKKSVPKRTCQFL